MKTSAFTLKKIKYRIGVTYLAAIYEKYILDFCEYILN